MLYDGELVALRTGDKISVLTQLETAYSLQIISKVEDLIPAEHHYNTRGRRTFDFQQLLDRRFKSKLDSY